VLGAMTADHDFDAAVTAPFLRYDVEVAAQPRRFVRTVTNARPYEPAWFDSTEGGLAKIEDPEPTERKESWWWLAISLACAGAAIAAITL
jgi:hypothetical protein